MHKSIQQRKKYVNTRAHTHAYPCQMLAIRISVDPVHPILQTFQVYQRLLQSERTVPARQMITTSMQLPFAYTRTLRVSSRHISVRQHSSAPTHLADRGVWRWCIGIVHDDCVQVEGRGIRRCTAAHEHMSLKPPPPSRRVAPVFAAPNMLKLFQRTGVTKGTHQQSAAVLPSAPYQAFDQRQGCHHI
jgi:hypothetical protein